MTRRSFKINGKHKRIVRYNKGIESLLKQEREALDELKQTKQEFGHTVESAQKADQVNERYGFGKKFDQVIAGNKKIIATRETMLNKQKAKRDIKDQIKQHVDNIQQLSKEYVQARANLNDSINANWVDAKSLANWRTSMVAHKLHLKTTRDKNGKLKIEKMTAKQKKQAQALRKKLSRNKLTEKIKALMGEYEKLYGKDGKIDNSNQLLELATDYVLNTDDPDDIEISDAIGSLYKSMDYLN